MGAFKKINVRVRACSAVTIMSWINFLLFTVQNMVSWILVCVHARAVHACVCVHVRVCVCVCERERERDSVRVHVCVCV